MEVTAYLGQSNPILVHSPAKDIFLSTMADVQERLKKLGASARIGILCPPSSENSTHHRANILQQGTTTRL